MATKKETKTAKKTTKKPLKAARTKAPVQKKEIRNEIKTPKKEVRSESSTTASTPVQPIVHKRKVNKIAVAIITIIILLGLAYFFKNLFIVATVNNTPVTRSEFDHEMEKSAGKQALNDIVTKLLIFQEADRLHVTVSDSDINSEMKKIETQLKASGQTLDSALASRNLTVSDLKDQIKIKKIVDVVLGKNITVSEQEVADFISKNKDSIPAAEQDNPSQATKDSVKQRLLSDKLSTKFQTWVDGLQKKAKINYLIKI